MYFFQDLKIIKIIFPGIAYIRGWALLCHCYEKIISTSMAFTCLWAWIVCYMQLINIKTADNLEMTNVCLQQRPSHLLKDAYHSIVRIYPREILPPWTVSNGVPYQNNIRLWDIYVYNKTSTSRIERKTINILCDFIEVPILKEF